MNLWTEIFGDTHTLSIGQECARATLVFTYGLLLVRFAGRRAFGKWAALDIIVSIILGSNLSRTITGSAPLIGTLAATTLILLLHWAAAQAAARSRTLSFLLEGRAVDLVLNGEFHEQRTRRHSVSLVDLDEALRDSGLETIDQAEKVVLEPSGKINVLARQ